MISKQKTEKCIKCDMPFILKVVYAYTQKPGHIQETDELSLGQVVRTTQNRGRGGD